MSQQNPEEAAKALARDGKELGRQIRELILKNKPQNVSEQPDAQYEAEKLDLETEKKKVEIRGATQDTDERKKYAHRTFVLVCFWLSAIALTIIAQGFRIGGFSLDSGVVIALIGGTTTGVLGIFLIVAQYLFPRK